MTIELTSDRPLETLDQILGVPSDHHSFPKYPIETAQQEALKFLQQLATEDGAIVSSSVCGALEIALARASDRFFVDHQGHGYIRRRKKWRQTAETALYDLTATVSNS